MIVENGIAFPDLWRIHLQLRGIKYSETALEESADIKGLDFAHVMVFLMSSTYRAATEHFQGSGQNGYAQYRLMRIPFSRARDSLTVWVYSFDDDAE